MCNGYVLSGFRQGIEFAPHEEAGPVSLARPGRPRCGQPTRAGNARQPTAAVARQPGKAGGRTQMRGGALHPGEGRRPASNGDREPGVMTAAGVTAWVWSAPALHASDANSH